MLLGNINTEGEQTVSPIAILPIFIYWFCYFVVIESIYGATFGHQLFHLKVLTVDRKKINFSQALKRHLLDFIDVMFYGIPASIAINRSEKHQRLGDMWANTIVVDTKDPYQFREQ